MDREYREHEARAVDRREVEVEGGGCDLCYVHRRRGVRGILRFFGNLHLCSDLPTVRKL